MCLNRYDTQVKNAFLDFYSQIDPDMDKKIEDVDGMPIFTPNVPPIAPAPPLTLTPDDLVKMRKNAQAAQAAAAQAPAQELPGTMVVFGSAQNVAELAKKYRMAITVSPPDKISSERIVTALGMKRAVKLIDIVRRTGSGDYLEDIIKDMLDKASKIGNNSTATDDDDDN